jgi:hypothetical protein
MNNKLYTVPSSKDKYYTGSMLGYLEAFGMVADAAELQVFRIPEHDPQKRKEIINSISGLIEMRVDNVTES